jgi:hypothetical protein
MTLEVIGAGWGRTGTLSTKVALERLGLGPCYHMIEVFRTHPEHRALWRRAAAENQANWPEIFSGYRATVDWPSCAFWRELADAYPRARVLLTYRPGGGSREQLVDRYEEHLAEVREALPADRLRVPASSSGVVGDRGRHVSTAVEDSPDVDVVVVGHVEDEVRETLRGDCSQLGDVELVREPQ